MSEELVQIGRLALRHEGENWNAYYALTDTMEDAIPLGSIHMSAVVGNEDRRHSFIDLMRGIVSDIVADKTGIVPHWKAPKAAPEKERAGHA